jgi:hypothetical protein
LCLSTRVLGVFARYAPITADDRAVALLGFACSFGDPSSSRPRARATLWSELRVPLLGFVPLRRLRPGRPHHIRLPSRTLVPLVPILTASATSSEPDRSGSWPVTSMGFAGSSGSSPHVESVGHRWQPSLLTFRAHAIVRATRRLQGALPHASPFPPMPLFGDTGARSPLDLHLLQGSISLPPYS